MPSITPRYPIWRTRPTHLVMRRGRGPAVLGWLGRLTFATELVQQRGKIFGVLFLVRQDVFHHAARGRIVVTQVLDNLAVAVDGDALGHQILLQHIGYIVALCVIGVAAAEQALGVEVGRAIELGDALGNAVGMTLLLVGVFQELRGHALGMNALGHVVVIFVAQYANDLGRQRLIQYLDHRLAVGAIAVGDRSLVDVRASTLANGLDIGKKRFLGGHTCLLMTSGWDR